MFPPRPSHRPTSPLLFRTVPQSTLLPQVALGILRRGGHTDVAVAENGQVALDVIAARGGIDSFDLILMDLHMPIMVGCSSIQWHKEKASQVA